MARNIKNWTKAELLTRAEDFGIQLPEKVTKAQIISALEAKHSNPELPTAAEQAKPDLPSPRPEPAPIAVAPEKKAHCKCCRELVGESMLYICPKCSFEGCQICRKSGNCPTCGYKLRGR